MRASTVKRINEQIRRVLTWLAAGAPNYIELHVDAVTDRLLNIADLLDRHAPSIADVVVFTEVVVFLTLICAVGVFALLRLL
jgi:hypothetical protein